MAGIKQLRSYFFGVSSTKDRLRNKDIPTQQLFENLLESIGFKTESGDRARVSTGASVGSEQGLAVLASDVQAKANTTQLTDRSLVTQPHQLPTAEAVVNSAVEDMPLTPLAVTTGVATTRNQYTFRLNSTWISWLVSRLFKAAGIAGDVPIKTNGTDYNWSWGNVGDNATTVTKIANNATFVSQILANTSFINALTTQIITNSATAIVDALPVGTPLEWLVAAMPSSKWLRMDGSAISRTTYSGLFALIGTTYGVGNGTTTFNIPDLKDKQTLGYSGTKAIASTAGADTHTIASANLPDHTHGIGSLATANESGHFHGVPAVDPGMAGTDTGFGYYTGTKTTIAPGSFMTSPNANGHNHTITGSSGTGSFANDAINHLDPYVAVNKIIKVLP